MRLLQRMVSVSTACLLVGLLGGLALGYALSRNGGWLTPVPWAVYLVLLLTAIAVLSWVDVRSLPRRVRIAVPLPAGYAGPLPAPSTDAVTTVVAPDAAPAAEPRATIDAAATAADDLPVALEGAWPAPDDGDIRFALYEESLSAD